MHVLMLEAPTEFLRARRRMGGDIRDEVWDGVLHVVPQPTYWHQDIGMKLGAVLLPLAQRRGWGVAHEVGLVESVRRNYRVPDLIVLDPATLTEKGHAPTAKLVVEILSPKDESRAKLPFYARVGVEEVWLLDRESRNVEVHVLRDGAYVESLPIDDATPTSVLDLTLRIVAGPKLRIEWHDGFAVI